MGDDPTLVHGVAMKAASKLVVHSATGHLFESCGEYVPKLLARGTFVHAGSAHVGTDALVRPAERSSACVVKDKQVKDRRMREFRCGAESTIGFVKHLQRGFDDFINNLR